MNHTPANVSSTKRFHFHRHSETDYKTMIREQPPTDYQIHPRIHCREFTLALIALHDVARRSSVNSLLRIIHKDTDTTIHKHIMDKGNNETKGFEIVTQLVLHDNTNRVRNLFAPPRQMGVWCHSAFYTDADSF